MPSNISSSTSPDIHLQPSGSFLPRMRRTTKRNIFNLQLLQDDPTSNTAALRDQSVALSADRDAIFTSLITSHWSKLNSFVARRVGNLADAEDITQQTFLEAVSSYSTFNGSSQVSTWLYGIALNLIRNHLSRSPHRKNIYESDDTLEALQTCADGPEESLAFFELVEIIHREVIQLPHEMQQVFASVVFEDMTYEEVAVQLVIPVGTVRSRLSRARDILRKKLEDKSIEVLQQKSKRTSNRSSLLDLDFDVWSQSEIHLLGGAKSPSEDF